ncbi:hypothetical protein SAMN04488057_110138 [Cyclobacterium lianum]|uniref:Glycosyltransferase n=1 Tax=Cyclobacterium lianum TaxID=388280 RepID=A0A1M7PTX6_9BACT|nr:TIGR04282 family arsenosugar biosynthesis glycosyltransferase [Cyclobacterium lianum]SHN20819.1 hypothetical protein SAMN04488057_110138 [Cyclobacterium lianum]
MKKAIIVFQKYPEPGKVKTRLAATIGASKAANIYACLVRHTHRQVQALNAVIFVYYQGPITTEEYPKLGYWFQKQQGIDLGERMSRAFQEVFKKGFEQVLVIGTDCLELESKHLYQAYSSLDKKDIVIGPARDGGYYLLGMRKYFPGLFQGIAWSTSSVFEATLKNAQSDGLSCGLLETLNDVDRYEDLGKLKEILEQF